MPTQWGAGPLVAPHLAHHHAMPAAAGAAPHVLGQVGLYQQSPSTSVVVGARPAPAASGAATTESLGDMAAEAFFASQIPAVIGLSQEDSSPKNVALLKPIRVLRADLWKDHVSGCSIVKKQLISKNVPQELAHSIWLRLQEIFCVDTANLFFVPGSFVGNPISRDSVAQILELFTGIGVNAGPSTAYIDPMSELSAAFTASGIRVTMPDSITTTQNALLMSRVFLGRKTLGVA